jgi:colicin import membrane protein
MTSAALGHDVFAPPKESGWGRAALLAVAAHAGLVLALALSVNWRAKEAPPLEAELWSVVPMPAAPAPAVAPEPPPAAPPPTEPERLPPAPAANEPPAQADIATERAIDRKQRLESQRKEQRAREKEQERAKESEKAARRKQKEEERLLAKEQAKEKAKEKAREKDKAKEKEREKELAKAEEERLESVLAAQREAALKRSLSLAESSGTSGTGTAARASGPSVGYPGRIKARIKPNIVLTEAIPGNPVAEIEIRLSPEGRIIGMKIVRSSGVPEWDAAAQRAIERTEMLPPDIDGRVPPVMVLSLRPRE